MLEERQIIENKYKVKKKLNDNNLYLVTDIRMMTLWMIKEVSLEEISGKETVMNELEQLKKINHRIFPKVVEILKTDQYLYVVMEPVQGKIPSETEKKSQKEIITWAIQLCDGLKCTEQMHLKNICWKHQMKDMRMEDGSLRLQDFAVVSAKERTRKQEIKEIAEFIADMPESKLKVSGKLHSIVQRCREEDTEYETYEQLAEALERYLIENTKRKKIKKQLCSAGMVIMAGVLICFMGSRILKSKKVTTKATVTVPVQTQKEPGNQMEEIKAIEQKAKDKNKKTTTPSATVEQKPVELSTAFPKQTQTPKIKKEVTDPPNQETSVVVKPQVTNKVAVTLKPKVTPKKTKEPEVEIELEGNDMEITIGE